MGGPDGVRAVLDHSRSLGFLGPGDVEGHITHAAGFAVAAARGHEHTRALDLGAGGGVPGLVLAAAQPTWTWVFLDSMERRTDFLREAVEQLGMGDRVEVRRGRAEDAARDPVLRGTFDLVVARGFGPPAVTAECASPFLRSGGLLVVSEPPGGLPDRWRASGLAELGCSLVRIVEANGATFAVIQQISGCPERYPRRTGVPAKRPLF